MKDKAKAVLIKVRAFYFKTRYFWLKAGLTALTLLLTTVLSFLLIKSLPGDVVHNYALTLQNNLKISYDEALTLAKRMLNYDPDQSVVSAFFGYLGGIFRGNLGQSIYMDNVNVNSVIKQYLPWTLLVSSVSLALSFLIGTYMGVKMARRRNSATDTALTGVVTLTGAFPDYLLAIILLMYLGSALGWFPTFGAYDLDSEGNLGLRIVSILHHAALPVLVYTVSQMGNWALLSKGSAVAVLGDDYVNAAVVRGLPPKIIEKRYLKKNALLPLITTLVISFAYLFGGSAVMESVFAYPGLGRAFAGFIGKRDYFIVQGLFVFLSFMIVMANLLADFLCGFLDPRIRQG